jgi:uncharacterized SAM-binding protein YcdF (DUF218 family)
MPAPSRRSGSRLAASALLILAAAWAISALAVIVWGRRDSAAPSDAIVVLGAAQYAGHPSPVLRARLDHALERWDRRLAPRLILTGGTGAGDTTSEAAVGRRYVLRRGVPDSAIFLEHEGRTTRQSLAAVADIMRVEGLRSAILVSDPFHMLRLHILARQFGLETLTSPTPTSPISANRGEAVGYVFSESVKVPLTVLLSLLPR